MSLLAAAAASVSLAIPAAASAPTHDLYQGKPIRWWASHAVQNRRLLNSVRRDRNALWASKVRLELRSSRLERELRGARAALRRSQRVLLSRPSVAEAINLAATVYGNGETLWRKARCETGGTFNPRSYNPSGASGLFQFLPSTWASTPYARFSVWSPYANALAAGWMHSVGRGGEWACR